MKKFSNDKPKVSIIIPVYNGAEYVENCLKSVINQTLTDIEILCMNDGSTDNTREIIEKLAKKDGRIRIINKNNTGYGNTVNQGIQMARGEYIGIVESDDYIENSMCENLYNIVKKDNLDVIKANFSRFYGEGILKEIENVPITQDKSYYGRVICPRNELYVFNFIMNIVTGLYRKSFLEENKITLNETPGASFQDNGFWIKTYLLAERLEFVDEYYYRCRRDNPNSSVKRTDKAFIVAKEFDLTYEWLKQDSTLCEIFIEKFVYLQCVGYFSVYNRSNIEHRLQFVMYFNKRYKEYEEQGLINPMYYGPIVWKKLNKIITNPIGFFLEDVINNKSTLKEWNQSIITETQNKYLDCVKKLREVEKELRLLKLTSEAEISDYVNERHKKCLISQLPYVSVIVPVYNMESLVEETLKSIASQTLKNIEVICVDDGSIDETHLKILNFAKHDDRFSVFSINNSGAGYARNYALEKAIGKYVVFMDGDDFYPDNETLEVLYKCIEEKDVFVCGGGVDAYADGQVIKGLEYYSFDKEGIVEYKDYQMDYGYTRYIYNREFLKNNNITFPNYLRFQDPPFFVKVMVNAQHFYAINRTVYVYRKSHKRVEWNSEKCLGLLKGFKDILILAKEYKLEELKNRIIDRIRVEYSEVILNEIKEDNYEVIEVFVDICKLIEQGANNNVFLNPWYQMFVLLKKNIDKESRQNEKEKSELLRLTRINENNKKEITLLNENLEKRDQMISNLRFRLYHIQNSFTYKMGRFLTFIPRKVRELTGWKSKYD